MKPSHHISFLSAAGLIVAALAVLSGCATTSPNGATSDSAPTEKLSEATVNGFRGEAARAKIAVKSTAAQEFLRSTEVLVPRAARELYVKKSERRFLTPTQFAALKVEEQTGFERERFEDAFYYATYYGSPLGYARAIDVAGSFGLASLSNARVLDIGYGAIGGPRLMASAGAQVSAVDVDPMLPALYREPSDQGPVLGFDRRTGSLRLFDGVYAGSTTLTKLVGSGYNLIVSKNTMKNGFMKPATGRKALVDFQASDEVLLDAISDALASGGLFVIYNIGNKFDPARPATDGRSPFTKAQFERANLEVLAFDQNDDARIRDLGRALGWDSAASGGIDNFFALFTVAKKK